MFNGETKQRYTVIKYNEDVLYKQNEYEFVVVYITYYTFHFDLIMCLKVYRYI